MKKIRINFEKFSDGILIPQFPWPKTARCSNQKLLLQQPQCLGL